MIFCFLNSLVEYIDQFFWKLFFPFSNNADACLVFKNIIAVYQLLEIFLINLQKSSLFLKWPLFEIVFGGAPKSEVFYFDSQRLPNNFFNPLRSFSVPIPRIKALSFSPSPVSIRNNCDMIWNFLIIYLHFVQIFVKILVLSLNYILCNSFKEYLCLIILDINFSQRFKRLVDESF